ncbi:MAG: phosphate acyltransferase PlsX [Dehalococcoidia bacterium]|nr:phosphate acyltransferase PlsX [Dehalococcoidia bacterium]
MKIAVDAMGGDLAPDEIIKGAAEAASKGTHIILVGAENIISPILKQYSTNSHVTIVDAPQVIGFEETATKAVRRKQHSSIVMGIDLVKNGEAAAFVSAGHTGAVVTAAILHLGKAKGVIRPALGILFPTMAGSTLILDIGANSDCKPQFLLGFARLGHEYASQALRIANPRIGLLSNGEECTKGNRLVRDAHKMLENCKLNFVGNLEGKDVMRGNADVVVTDGFTGNTMIKTIEGFGELIFHMIGDSISKLDTEAAAKGSGQLSSASALKPAIAAMWKRLDWSEHGGAVLLGVKGSVVVAHGRSKAKAISNAIRVARIAADRVTEAS